MKPLFSCSEIVSSFSCTFKKLGLLQNLDIFESNSNKLILGLLVLMHKRKFHIGKDFFGETTLDFPVDCYGKLKSLELRGTIQIPDLVGIAVTLIETPLEFAAWCEPDLLVQKETSVKDHYWTLFDKGADFTIGENGKLRKL